MLKIENKLEEDFLCLLPAISVVLFWLTMTEIITHCEDKELWRSLVVLVLNSEVTQVIYSRGKLQSHEW